MLPGKQKKQVMVILREKKTGAGSRGDSALGLCSTPGGFLLVVTTNPGPNRATCHLPPAGGGGGTPISSLCDSHLPAPRAPRGLSVEGKETKTTGL